MWREGSRGSLNINKKNKKSFDEVLIHCYDIYPIWYSCNVQDCDLREITIQTYATVDRR